MRNQGRKRSASGSREEKTSRCFSGCSPACRRPNIAIANRICFIRETVLENYLGISDTFLPTASLLPPSLPPSLRPDQPGSQCAVRTPVFPVPYPHVLPTSHRSLQLPADLPAHSPAASRHPRSGAELCPPPLAPPAPQEIPAGSPFPPRSSSPPAAPRAPLGLQAVRAGRVAVATARPSS